MIQVNKYKLYLFILYIFIVILHISSIIEINEKRHQYKGSECGVYCLHFLITMITKNIEFDDFCGKHMPDNVIFNYRKQYFIS